MSTELIVAILSACTGTIFVAGMAFNRLSALEKVVQTVQTEQRWLVKSVTALLIKQGLHVPAEEE